MDVPADLAQLIRSQHGVFTTGQALGLGLDGRDVGRLRARGAIERIRRGAYALRQDWSDWDDRDRHRAAARVLALQLGAPFTFSHQTAAVLHDLPLLRGDLSELHVTRDGRTGLTRHEAGVWHHAGPSGDVVRVAELAVTSLARTALDVTRVTDLHTGVALTDAVLARDVTAAHLFELLDEVEHWPGTGRTRRALALADGRAESPGETVARLVFGYAGLAAETLQLELRTDRGPVRTDFAWPSRGVVGEFDGRIKYGRLLKPGQGASDVLLAERQRELAIERTGWSVVRFTWDELRDTGLVRRRLLETFERAARRGRRGAAG